MEMNDFDFERDAPIDARTGRDLRGIDPFAGMVANGTPDAKVPTIAELLEICKTMSEAGEPLKFAHGADMCNKTWERLQLTMSHVVANEKHILWTKFSSIEVHLVEGIPVGEVRECACMRRLKL